MSSEPPVAGATVLSPDQVATQSPRWSICTSGLICAPGTGGHRNGAAEGIAVAAQALGHHVWTVGWMVGGPQDERARAVLTATAECVAADDGRGRVVVLGSLHHGELTAGGAAARQTRIGDARAVDVLVAGAIVGPEDQVVATLGGIQRDDWLGSYAGTDRDAGTRGRAGEARW